MSAASSPSNSVEIRSRLSGYLSEIHFTDGQMVKQGDLLFTIDRRPFEIALEQMKANLPRPAPILPSPKAIWRAASNSSATRPSPSRPTISARKPRASPQPPSPPRRRWCIRPSSISTHYSELRSPIDGRIGDRRVAVGNLITGGAGGDTTLLATIVSVDPIRFEFSFDEASYLRYQRFATANKQAGVDGGVPVSLKLIDESDFVHQGKIDFVDNVIDRSSGTIRGRAVFANADGIFTPGMFGRIRVPGSPPYTALLIPDAAIGTEQARKFVLVVDDNNMARQRYITLGQLDGGLRVVKDGLATSDRVIVNGLMRVRTDQKVTPQQDTTPPKGPNEAKAVVKCASRISSSTGRSSPPSSPSCS